MSDERDIEKRVEILEKKVIALEQALQEQTQKLARSVAKAQMPPVRR